MLSHISSLAIHFAFLILYFRLALLTFLRFPGGRRLLRVALVLRLRFLDPVPLVFFLFFCAKTI